jgi:hypothetical protein
VCANGCCDEQPLNPRKDIILITRDDGSASVNCHLLLDIRVPAFWIIIIIIMKIFEERGQ